VVREREGGLSPAQPRGADMRVYVPGTSRLLRELIDSEELPASPVQPMVAFAVTPGLREYYADDPDEEALEYAAFTEAARASLRLIDADESSWRRRVVISIDVDQACVEIKDDLDHGVVRLGQSVSLASVASVHVDDVEAEDVVAAAAAGSLAAELGDDSAQDAVDDAEGFELSWYAAQEIGPLLDLA